MGWLNRIAAITRSRKLERDLDEELQFHIELKTKENIAAGMPPEEARYAALRAFGSMEQKKEECRDADHLRWLEDICQDLRYGLRQLRRNPGFATVAVLTLALGIGANTAVFTALNSLLFQSLPYPHPKQLVVLKNLPAVLASPETPAASLLNWAGRIHSFRSITAYVSPSGANLSGGGEPEHVLYDEVLPNFFETLGVSLLQGPGFTSDPDNKRVAIISYRLWQTQFGGKAGVVGTPVKLNGAHFVVVGIASPGFSFPRGTNVWTPLAITAGPQLGNVVYFGISYLGRLKNGVDFETAQAEMNAFSQVLEKIAGRKVRPIQMFELAGFDAMFLRDALLILFGASGFVLLLACVNVANLNLSRNASRRHELAVRMALGAGRIRIVGRLITENVLLALAGGAAGVFVAEWGVGALRELGPAILPRMRTIQLDGHTLAYALAVSMVAAMASGLLPALRATKIDPNESLKESSTPQSTVWAQTQLRRALATMEIALAMLLVIGAGLLIHSFARLLRVSPGFEPDHVLTARVTAISPRFRGRGPGSWGLFGHLLKTFAEIPGVEAAGAATYLPLAGEAGAAFRYSAGGQHREAAEGGNALFSAVRGDYFKVMGIRLLRGRAFSPEDKQTSAPVVVVSRSFANRYWPHENPIGKHIKAVGDNLEIVGVVRDVRPVSLGEMRGAAYVYLPCWISPLMPTFLVVRTHVDPRGLITPLQQAARKVDPAFPLYDIQTMDQRLSDSLARRKLILLMLAAMAAIALMLGAVGIAGVTSSAVALRTHEIGIRMALGAEKSDVLRMVVGQGLKLALIGVAIGIAGALALTRFLSSLLYGVKPTDPLTFIAVSLILIAVALLACYIPARRAAKVDPMVALRYE